MTKKCKSCRTDIDAKARNCPHCKADQRSWFARHPIVIGIVILIAIFGIIGTVHIISKNVGSSSQAQLEQSQSTSTGGNSFIQGHVEHGLQHLGL